ncbi:MAG TPA: DUF882 domain-containing protein [Desulfomicrobiaceae bacterium]|nr:DUF882 domain-containing protein [Desulfomicrobiaceae bacterium]
MTRRDFLSQGLVAGATVCALPGSALAALTANRSDRSLSFFNTHTGENLSIRYHDGAGYRQEALRRINHIFRDHRTGDVARINPELLDLLFSLRLKTDANSPFSIISGYRSPTTNALLRKKSSGVAKKSLHTQGLAVDIRVPGFSLKRLHRAAVALKGGGVGYYSRSQFIHIDVGPVRYW